METLLDVVRVEAKPDHTLVLEFENGELRVFDMTPLLDKQPFVHLKSVALFALGPVNAIEEPQR